MTGAPGRTWSWRALLFIVIGNLIPVVGVIALGWDAAQILILYWCENVAVGLFTLPRILTAQAEPASPEAMTLKSGDRTIPLKGAAGRGCLGCFFTLHYGVFCVVHGVFAAIMAGQLIEGGDEAGSLPFAGLWDHTFGNATFRWALLAVGAVQAALFVREWVLTAQWRRADPPTEMMRPYDRILVMHFTVLLGAWGLAAISAPASAVLILCGVKTVIELLTETRGGLLLKPRAGGTGPG